MARRRISHEPAFVLHRHDWSESSLIVELLTRHHGRIAVAARGARRSGSALRPVLLPLQPLRVTCSLGSEHAEIHNLRAAEWAGGHIMPQGDALLSGYYLNELLLGLLARDDAHEKLFDAYEVVVSILADGHPDALEPVLRAFELLLLRETGVLPDLSLQTMTAQPLQPQACYALAPESGLRLALPQERGNLPGAHWLRIQLALDSGAGCVAVMQACAESVQALKPQLRALLQHHCASHAFRTRQLMVDMQSLV